MPKTAKYLFTTSMNLDIFVEKELRKRSRITGASLSKLVNLALVQYLDISEPYEEELNKREALLKRNKRFQQGE